MLPRQKTSRLKGVDEEENHGHNSPSRDRVWSG